MPKVDGARVLADLRALAAIGAYKTGVHKPALRPDHIRSLAWFVERLNEAGLDPVTDGIGNVIGYDRRPGRKLLTGSHLESQNYAGWLDGPLGVIYGLEAARALREDPSTRDLGVEVIAFCDEEGHFGHFLGSRSFAGQVSDADIDQATCRTDGARMRDLLSAAGFSGRPREIADPARYVGYLEAHIEQGDWLEANQLKIGVVTSIVGIWQFRIVFEGVQNHAGTTRMAIRKDAGVACTRFAVALEERFPRICGPRTVWTTGRITFEPGAPSIIPGRAEMLFQIRDADRDVLERLERAIFDLAAEFNDAGPCTVKAEAIRKSYPAVMADSFRSAISTAAAKNEAGATEMPSGAGHDAQVMAERMPAGMVFVPSIGGISHHWTENTSDSDIVLGAQVFADAAVALLRGG